MKPKWWREIKKRSGLIKSDFLLPFFHSFNSFIWHWSEWKRLLNLNSLIQFNSTQLNSILSILNVNKLLFFYYYKSDVCWLINNIISYNKSNKMDEWKNSDNKNLFEYEKNWYNTHTHTQQEYWIKNVKNIIRDQYYFFILENCILNLNSDWFFSFLDCLMIEP